ncbi:DUF262 domain-containing protein [Microbacterium sp. cx-59]|uniref:DUF262 domain-containing protein n=1 Tax=Microbacterium sp. cx-59 TaxID=2891207 RepID=UPI001E4DB73B|nr:DUF262 domain-containing protein [Microbacterium sp. cx-59]MCC4907073.1 DUF262 domain-containing HNH endonuclease family protein [Microbacterium sp. cx-59]
MVSATNVDATAVNTIAWLSASDTRIVVPVYQRQYRWDIGACEQLLGDIRAVADLGDGHTHFLASILSSRGSDADAGELVLIDGQQRITTLMLLIAALQHTVADSDPALAAETQRVLVRSDDPERTRLRPHRAWAGVFESIVRGRHSPGADEPESRFADNYAFFRSQIRADEAPRIWRGLQRLEHVAIALGAGANAQQIFESLNSTGEPLRDHELIHNYVLMGLSHAEQTALEDAFWVPIEQNTGSSIADFWRHYLVMRTGRELAGAAPRGVYEAFRREFPVLDPASLPHHAAEWKQFSEIYRVLLEPAHAPDEHVARHLGYVNTFGRSMYPLVLRAYGEWVRGETDRDELVAVLESIQSLLVRRAIVGLSNDRLVARLCRARSESAEELGRAFGRITPSDVRVRAALKYTDLPHPAYVLGRISGVDSVAEFGVEHVFPLVPGDDWSGDDTRVWADYSDDEQNSHRALARTLGNLALLEDPLAERILDASFPDKRAIYAKSDVPLTRALAARDAWGTAAIADRTVTLSDTFVATWERPVDVLIDDDDLTPILDATQRRGFPPGWQREWSYVEYRGEHWEIYDVAALFNRIFRRLWADARSAVIAFSDRRGGPVYDAQAWNGQWDELGDGAFLYMGWDSGYMLSAIQGVLDEAGIAAEVFVKYSYIGTAMRD